MLATRTLKNAFFFEKFYRGHDPPRSRRSLYTPPVETPAPSAPGTATRHRQQRRPCQNQGGQVPGQTAARTLDTLHRSALDTRPPALDRSGLCRTLEGGQLLYHAYCDSSIIGIAYYLCSDRDNEFDKVCHGCSPPPAA